MARLIQDVYPQYRNLEAISTEVLIATLFIRGVSISDIFAKYYEYEATADARDDELFGNDEDGQHGRPPLTVADAELAGFTRLPDKPLPKQPF